MVGIALRRDTGRPEIAYGRKCKPQELEHELRVTDFANSFKDAAISREAKVGNTEADGSMTLDGERCFLEIDNSGKMNGKQMKAKWKRYEGVKGWILVVAVTEGRMERLRRGAELVKNAALFNTFARLKEGLPWSDWYGNTADL